MTDDRKPTAAKETLSIEDRLGAARVNPQDATHRTRIVEIYIAALNAADLDAVVGVFAEEALLLDPLGAPPIIGISAVKEFFARGPFSHPIKATLDSPVRVAGNAAAFAFTAHSDGKEMHIIDVFEFDTQGKVEKMVAYWSNTNTT